MNIQTHHHKTLNGEKLHFSLQLQHTHGAYHCLRAKQAKMADDKSKKESHPKIYSPILKHR